MKNFTIRYLILRLFLSVLFLYVLLSAARAFGPLENYTPTNGDFVMVENAVSELLRNQNAQQFADRLSPTIEDFKSILSTNAPVKGVDPLDEFRSAVTRQRKQVEVSAEELLAKAKALHLDFSKEQIWLHVNAPKAFGSTRYGTLQAENESLPYAPKIEFEFNFNSAPTNSSAGNFKIVIPGLTKFPEGWRLWTGIQWLAFPTNIADAKTKREMLMLTKAASYQGFNDTLDPALDALGQNLVRFVQTRDPNVCQQSCFYTADMQWAQMIKHGQDHLSRKDFDEWWTNRGSEMLDAAQTVVKQMDAAGINLSNAEIQIKTAEIKSSYPRSGPGSVDGLEGEHYTVQLTVKSDDKSKTGQSLSGDYTLAADEITRVGNDWRISGKVRWQKLPTGVIDEKTAVTLELENYVAEHRALPPGMVAPEIEFVRLNDEQKMKLSDLHGKIVLLDFWATWCGPCQEPMAKLQTLQTAHPEWKDKVVIIPLSIDDTLKQVRDHVNKRGWTNTFNVWAGSGGWQSTTAKTFRVTGVPTTYIVDTQGKIFWEGYPDENTFVQSIRNLLKTQR